MFATGGFIVGMALKIAVISACGLGASAFMDYFSKYKPSVNINKKKGDRDEHVSESMRERAKSLR